MKFSLNLKSTNETMMNAKTFILISLILISSPLYSKDASSGEKDIKPASNKTETTNQSAINLGVIASFDCIHNFNIDKGKTQNCLGIGGLSFIAERRFDRVYGSISLNPFGSPSTLNSHRPIIDDHPTTSDHKLGIIENYQVVWSPRPHLEFGMESFDGNALYPNISPLTLSNPFMESGWKQTALTLTYNLLALPEMKVRFAAGNGEGENGANLDAQQYFGFDMSALIFKGVKAHLGVSLDGNSSGSEENLWNQKILEDQCGVSPSTDADSAKKAGYSTQRISLGVIVTGIWPGSEGIKLGLGYQRNILSDLNKKDVSQANPDELKKCPRIAMERLFLENAIDGTVNTVQRTVYNVDLVYSNDEYFLGINYSQRDVDTGSVKIFDTCLDVASSRCIASENSPRNNLQMNSMSAGIGLYLSKASAFSLEYQVQNYDKLYNIANFSERNNSISKSRDVIDARYTVSLK